MSFEETAVLVDAIVWATLAFIIWTIIFSIIVIGFSGGSVSR